MLFPSMTLMKLKSKGLGIWFWMKRHCLILESIAAIWKDERRYLALQLEVLSNRKRYATVISNNMGPLNKKEKLTWKSEREREEKYFATFQLPFSLLKAKLRIRFQDTAWHQKENMQKWDIWITGWKSKHQTYQIFRLKPTFICLCSTSCNR